MLDNHVLNNTVSQPDTESLLFFKLITNLLLIPDANYLFFD